MQPHKSPLGSYIRDQVATNLAKLKFSQKGIFKVLKMSTVRICNLTTLRIKRVIIRTLPKVETCPVERFSGLTMIFPLCLHCFKNALRRI